MKKLEVLKKIEITHDKLFKQTAFILWLQLALATLFIMLLLLLINYLSPNGSFSSYFAEWKLFGLLFFAMFTFLLSMLNSEHRTVQTKHQINATESKNRTDLFLSHYKFNVELLEKIKLTFNNEYLSDSITFSIESPNITYRNFYPKNNIRDGVINIMPIKINNLSEKTIDVVRKNHDSNHGRRVAVMKRVKAGSFAAQLERKKMIETTYLDVFNIISNVLVEFGVKIESKNGYIHRQNIEYDSFWETYVLESMLDFWVYLNKMVDSDLDENVIDNVKVKISEFMKNIFDDYQYH